MNGEQFMMGGLQFKLHVYSKYSYNFLGASVFKSLIRQQVMENELLSKFEQ
jgi:hypothetical protein